ncbi:MAG: ABC transporter substrate-binding protein [Gemmatimonadaceae bacterium]|nr:ABC transporter substrate-binding protein [Gemmatimonadaceae bacterium]
MNQTLRRLFAVILLAACSGGASGPDILIGSAGPWKEGFGVANRRGIELAVEEINARGGIKGKPLRVLFRDDQSDGAVAATVAQEFVDSTRLVAVVGHVTSGAMVAAAKVYDGQLAAIATTATSPALSGISSWAFRVISSDSANGAALARRAAKLGRQRAAILYENDDYGRGLAEAFRADWKGTIVTIDPIPAEIKDAGPYIEYLKSRSVDLVMVAGTEVSGIALLQEARAQDFQADFIGGDGWTGIVSDTAAAEGALVGAPFTAADTRPEARAFVKRYTARYKSEPDGNAALGYDATMLLAHIIERTGGDRKRVRDALASLTLATAVPGVTGPLAFDRRGDPLGKSIVLTRVRAGVLIPATEAK